MNNNNAALTKICQNCGQQKPLATFMPYTDSAGRKIYGNICADCRQKIKDAVKREEGSTRSNPGGAGLRNKERFAKQQDAKEAAKNLNEAYYHQREVKQTTKDKFAEKTEAINQALKRGSLFTQSDKQASKPAPSTNRQENRANPSDVLRNTDTQLPKQSVLESQALKTFAAQNPSSAIGKIFNSATLKKSPLAKMFEKSLQKLTKQAEKPTETPVSDHINQLRKRR